MLAPFGDGSSLAWTTSDVGLVLRQLLTRTDSFFGGPHHLTLCDELVWGQVPALASSNLRRSKRRTEVAPAGWTACSIP